MSNEGSLTIKIPADTPDRDLRRVKQTAKKARRNAKIQRTYPILRDLYGWERAMEKLADRHGCSKSTVRKVLSGRR